MMADTFELYDLRVEIIAPEGARIHCGKVGDWFELRGEQLHLPQGQSFSIYSLSAIRHPAVASRQTAQNASERLDDL